MSDEKEPFRGCVKWNSDTRKFESFKEKPRPRVHQVITDDVPEGVQSMVTGRWYTSKARLREEYKAHGVEEVGNDAPESYVYNRQKDEKRKKKEEADVEEAVAKAYTMVRDGMAPLTEFDKERCKIINKQIKDSPDARERPIDRID